jgi:hypothetical protein
MDWSLIFSNALYTAISINAIAYALIAQGLNVHFGYTGLLNFGQAAFAAAGRLRRRHPRQPLRLVVLGHHPRAAHRGHRAGPALGIPTLRLRADYLAIVTIAASEIVRISLNSGALHVADRRQRRPAELHGRPAIGQPIGAHRFSLFAQRFNQYDLFIIICGWILVAPGVGVRLLPHAQPLGPGHQEHPGGRGRGPQPGQERLHLQDAEPDHRRHHRRLRRHGDRRRATRSRSRTTTAPPSRSSPTRSSSWAGWRG